MVSVIDRRSEKDLEVIRIKKVNHSYLINEENYIFEKIGVN